MKTKTLISAALVAAGMLTMPFALSQQGQKPHGTSKQQMPADSASAAPMGAQSPYAPQKWNKGDRLPAEFRDRQYVIDKYKEYNLPAPKKGYHWVGVGADYYQVSSNGTIWSVGPGG